MKILIFAQELVSVVLTPFVLWLALPDCAPAIIDFFREFSVHVDGRGYVCSFAEFNFERHGNVKVSWIKRSSLCVWRLMALPFFPCYSVRSTGQGKRCEDDFKRGEDGEEFLKLQGKCQSFRDAQLRLIQITTFRLPIQIGHPATHLVHST